MKVADAIEMVAEGEADLVHALINAGSSHRSEQDVFHIARTLARHESAHIEGLAKPADRFGASVVPLDPGELMASDPLRPVLIKGMELAANRSDPGVRLLLDLRQIHLLASGVALNWVVLAQGANVIQDEGLASFASACLDETKQAVKWSEYRIKSASPQILASSG